MRDKIGFIGLGIMGSPMAANLARNGCDLVVYNRTEKKAAPLEKFGAITAKSPADLFKQADIIFLMLTGPEAIDSLLEPSLDLLDGKILVNMSSVPPAYSSSLCLKVESMGGKFVDAPVSGSKVPAEKGGLVILASGSNEIIKRLEPYFLMMGKKVLNCGPVPSGSKMKMAINLLLGIMMEGLAESLLLAEKSGIDKESFLDAVLSGPLGCELFKVKEWMLKSDIYDPQFPLKHMTKDLGFILKTASEYDSAAPMGESLYALYQTGMKKGLGNLDFSAIKKVLEDS